VLLVVAACVPIPLEADAQLRTQVVASGLTSPVAFIPDPLFSNAFYIVEQGGVVKLLLDGQLQSAPVLDLRSVISTGGERGLLGMVFSPDAASGRVFFNFTNTAGHTVVARFRRQASTPLAIDPASRFDLLWPTGERFIRQPFANHNGGHLEFGPDGALYIGLGDGGSGNDPQNHAQNPFSLLGKMLRVDVSAGDGDPVGYRVPSNNPFVDGTPITALHEIWAFGLRNPWRYSFDNLGPGATGTLFIGDVGQGAREEIDVEPAGAAGRNYGWRLREGAVPTPGVPGTAPAYEPLVGPIFDYERSAGQAVTGGYVYRGSGLGAAYFGRYFFADYVASRVWSLGLTRLDGGEVAATDILEHTGELGPLGGIASFARDPTGELYLVTFAGRILKIVGSGSGAPGAPQSLAASVTAGTVTLSWVPPAGASSIHLEAGSAPGAANLAIASAAGTQTSMTFTDVPAGNYYVRVRAASGSALSGPSNEIVVMVGAPPGCTEAPSAPAALVATVNGASVTVAWSIRPNSQPAVQYAIEVGDASGWSNLALINVPGIDTRFTAQTPPGTYFVRVRALNACGTSSGSNEVVVRVP
jgi:glucose/arabinose dehydrogenase